MNTPNDGGPAFPKLKGLQQQVRANGPDYLKAEIEGGMSLRDYFAGQALIGIIQNSADINFEDSAAGANRAAAIISYQLADNMLRARLMAARDGKEVAA